MRWIDWLLDRITMYRLLLYYLGVLVIAAVVLSQADILHYSAAHILVSTAFLMAVCYVANHLFRWVWGVPVHTESALITALILALIITPPATGAGVLFLAAAAGLAMASKYLLNIGRQHIFNPAAIAVVLTNVGAGQAASWWVGNKYLLPIVVIGGLLLARKARRLQMTLIFLAIAVIAVAAWTVAEHRSLSASMNHTLFSSSLFFLAFVMLTEPMTSPHRLAEQRWYAVLVGLLFPPQVHVLGYYSTPEVALAVGNVFAFVVNPFSRRLPRLRRKERLAPSIADFIFTVDKPVRYKPGQYMEWTLPHEHADARGMRRYLTLASSPTEPDLRLGIKFYPKGSSFKKTLLAADAHTPIAAGQLSGDFIMPDDPSHKLAFIAGGIGVTPFRSMVKYLVDTQQQRDVVVLYSAAAGEHVYRDVFEAARAQFTVDTSYIVTTPSPSALGPHDIAGKLDAGLIKQKLPDYAERIFYISGTHPMVVGLSAELHKLGVPYHQIKTDFFPGYA